MSASTAFLRSALTEHNPFMPTESVGPWMEGLRRQMAWDVERIAFAELEGWSFAGETGNLVHDSGRFFSIEGIRVETDTGWVHAWSQPIINQPETGLLGFVVKKFGGVLYFLVQAKAEPGNVNGLQLSPTVQATRSNYSRVHRGKATAYLEHFVDSAPSRVLVDSMQPEQGGRFLRKQNRNMIVEVDADVAVAEHCCWLTLGQLHRLIQTDNWINMDARSVLSCIPYTKAGGRGRLPEGVDLSGQSAFGRAVLASSHHLADELNSLGAIIDWVTDLKRGCALSVEQIPLREVEGWVQGEREIRHEEGRFFEVIAVSVSGGRREVSSWTQPMVKPQQQGIVAFLCKQIDGVLHFLIQAKLEPGNFDVLELAPSVQCITGSYSEAPLDKRPPFLDEVIDAPPERIRFDAMQSEEGGRFFCEENRNLVVEVADDFPEELPPFYRWMTLNQLRELVRFSNYLNVEARSLLSCLGFS